MGHGLLMIGALRVEGAQHLPPERRSRRSLRVSCVIAIEHDPARRWSSMVNFVDALRGALPLSASNDDFKLSEPAPSASRTNDEATSSAAQPRRFWKTITLTANEQSARSPEPARAEPSEPATIELPTHAEQRPCVASWPPDHEVSNPPMSAPAPPSATAPHAPCK